MSRGFSVSVYAETKNDYYRNTIAANALFTSNDEALREKARAGVCGDVKNLHKQVPMVVYDSPRVFEGEGAGRRARWFSIFF